MRQEKESLKDLLVEVEYYANLIDLNNLKRGVLERYYLANYQFYYGKMHNARSDKKKFEYQKQAQNFWNLCHSLSPSKRFNMFNR